MVDDLLAEKAIVIERCVARIRGKYHSDPSTFLLDHDRQDIAVLNALRACQACIDMGQILVRHRRLGLPKSSRDVFRLLQQAGIINPKLAENLQRMAGFRNIAVHDYQAMEGSILVEIIENNLNDFSEFSQAVLRQGDAAPDARSWNLG
jgi:uncharacterized protein YutE (UPF0331/DUF86 family)